MDQRDEQNSNIWVALFAYTDPFEAALGQTNSTQ